MMNWCGRWFVVLSIGEAKTVSRKLAGAYACPHTMHPLYEMGHDALIPYPVNE